MAQRALVKREQLYAFFLEYIQNGGNATAAYLSIKPDVKRNTAKSMGSLILKEYPDLYFKIREELANANKNDVMDIQQRKKWLTDVILQRSDGVKASIRDRLSALKELNKMDGLTGDDSKVKVTITAEEQKKEYKELLENQFSVLDGDYQESEDEAS